MQVTNNWGLDRGQPTETTGPFSWVISMLQVGRRHSTSLFSSSPVLSRDPAFLLFGCFPSLFRVPVEGIEPVTGHYTLSFTFSSNRMWHYSVPDMVMRHPPR